MTKSDVIEGLKRLVPYKVVYILDEKDTEVFRAAITFLEQEREVMGADEIEKIIAHELYVRFGWRKNATAKSIAKALSNRIAKPNPESEAETLAQNLIEEQSKEIERLRKLIEKQKYIANVLNLCGEPINPQSSKPMYAIKTRIKELLAQGKSRAAIASIMEMPFSLVQSIIDKNRLRAICPYEKIICHWHMNCVDCGYLPKEAKPLPPEPEVKLPEEIKLFQMYSNETIMLAGKIIALIRWAKEQK